MADVYEQNLSAKSSLTTSDYIRVVGSDNVSYKQLVSDVAKKIIETYAGSTLAGSAQSVQSAINGLTGLGSVQATSYSTMLSNIANSGKVCVWKLTGVDTTNLPTGGNTHFGLAFINAAQTYGVILCLTFNNNVYMKSVSNGTWSSWRTV